MQTVRMARWILGLGCLLGPASADAWAQTPNTNRQFIRDLYFHVVRDDQEPPELGAQIATDSAATIAKFVAAALTSAPIVSSSAGFSYVRDQATGDLVLKSQSFGPTFAERPLTNGKGVVNFGAHFQFSRTSFDGAFGTTDGRSDGLPLFDNTATYLSDGFVQYITKRAFLESRTRTVSIAASVGLTDRFDVGVVLPIVSLTLEGRTEEDFDLTRQFNAEELDPVQRPTPTGIRTVIQPTTRSTTGLGDVAVRLKYFLSSSRADGVALAADIRLPTGNEDDLLGAGEGSAKVLLLFSKVASGATSIHGNAGYTVGGLSDEVNYIVGLDSAFLSQKQLTVSASFLGRTLREAARPTNKPTVRRTVNTGNTGPRDIVVDRFAWEPETMSLLQIALGAKVHIGGHWLLNGSVLLPLNERGFQPSITPAIGLERTWGR